MTDLDPFQFTKETRLTFPKVQEIVYDRIFFKILCKYETIQVWFNSNTKYQEEMGRALYFPGVINEIWPWFRQSIDIDKVNITLKSFLADRGYKLENEFDGIGLCSQWEGDGQLWISRL